MGFQRNTEECREDPSQDQHKMSASLSNSNKFRQLLKNAEVLDVPLYHILLLLSTGQRAAQTTVLSIPKIAEIQSQNRP